MKRTYATRHDVLGPDPKVIPAKGNENTKGKPKQKEGHRETVEAIVVAFILALLVRGFEAEAFVIPTGSMAPTLMGRHKEVTCPQCGYVYSVNASSEDEGGHPFGFAGLRLRPGEAEHRPSLIMAGTCVNCRYQASLGESPTFNGDRILVMKFPYDMPFLPMSSGPARWDVVVFRYPEEPEVSYIKRLVGLPGEELRVWHGDIYIKSPGGKEFRLERKPLRHQNAMAMMVYDDHYRAAALADKPEWRRWRSTTWTEKAADGDVKQGRGTFSISAAPGESAELRYHNIVPDPEQWEALIANQSVSRPPRPTLVTDFYSYNTNQFDESRGGYDGAWRQTHWVGDLSIACKLEVVEPHGVVRLEIVEGGVVNRCVLDLAKGTAELFHGSNTLNKEPVADVISRSGTYKINFTNIDDRLTLLVDGRAIFGDGLAYNDTANSQPLPTHADLAPVAITSVGAKLTVSDLVLKRDIYYTLDPGHSDYEQYWEERYPRSPAELFDNLAEPSRLSFLANIQPKDFPIGPERYLMLGDNSPMSKDSRGWSNRDTAWDPSNRASWEVPRDLLTGKAFFVYWPHGKPFGPDIKLSRDLRVPFRPYVERMKWIR